MSEITDKETKTTQEKLAEQAPKTEKIIEKELEKGKIREPEQLPLATEPGKPLISFDFDGVICRPPFGVNPAPSRRLHEDELPESIRMIDGPAATWQRRVYLQLYGMVDAARYFRRGIMPGAREGIIAVSQYRTPVIITGRSFLARAIIDAWLKKYKMEEYFSAIYVNNTALPTRQFKLHMLRRLNIDTHVDDDGGITYYLAKKGTPNLYLRDWPRNAGLPYPENVHHFTNIIEIAQDLAAKPAQVQLR